MKRFYDGKNGTDDVKKENEESKPSEPADPKKEKESESTAMETSSGEVKEPDNALKASNKEEEIKNEGASAGDEKAKEGTTNNRMHSTLNPLDQKFSTFFI